MLLKKQKQKLIKGTLDIYIIKMKNHISFSGIIKYLTINLLDRLEPLKGPLNENGYSIIHYNEYPSLDSKKDTIKF